MVEATVVMVHAVVIVPLETALAHVDFVILYVYVELAPSTAQKDTSPLVICESPPTVVALTL